MNLRFQRFGEYEFQTLLTWFSDPELAQRMSNPTTQWFDYVCHTPGVYAWMIYDGDEAVGYVQVDVEANNTASAALAVKAERRVQGYCKRILHQLLQRPEISSLSCIEGYVEEDNYASQRCVVGAGFRQMSNTPDEDGMLKYTYTF